MEGEGDFVIEMRVENVGDINCQSLCDVNFDNSCDFMS